MANLKFALFVEGGITPSPSRGTNPRDAIWNEHLCGALELQTFALIVPISKKHLVAMDPTQPKMSGAGEGFDELLARTLRATPFDVAVVAWDLVPAWNPAGEYCRWEETLDLYRFLSQSHSANLPPLWKDVALERFQELASRDQPNARPNPPTFKKGLVLPICMEPMFETLLVQDEPAARRAFDVSNPPNGWPSGGWGNVTERRPDQRILRPAIAAIQRIKPKLKCVRQVRGNFVTNKDGWGEFLLRQLLRDQNANRAVLASPISTRLREVVQPATS